MVILLIHVYYYLLIPSYQKFICGVPQLGLHIVMFQQGQGQYHVFPLIGSNHQLPIG